MQNQQPNHALRIVCTSFLPALTFILIPLRIEAVAIEPAIQRSATSQIADTASMDTKIPAQQEELRTMIKRLIRANKYVEALELQRQELLLAEKDLGMLHPATADSMMSLADLYKFVGRNDLAEQLFGKALEIYVTTLGYDHEKTIACLTDLANFYSYQGSHSRLLEIDRRLLEIYTRKYGKNSSKTLNQVSSLASAYSNLKKYDKALELYNQLLTAKQAVKGGIIDEKIRDVDLAELHSFIARLYEERKQLVEAESHYRQTLLIAERLDSAHSGPSVSTDTKIDALVSLAEIAYIKGARDIWSKQSKKALSILFSDPWESHSNHADFIASSYLAKGYWQDALSQIQDKAKLYLNFWQTSLQHNDASTRIRDFRLSFDTNQSMLFSNATRSSEATRMAIYVNLNYSSFLLDIEKHIGQLLRNSKTLARKASMMRNLIFQLGHPSINVNDRSAIYADLTELERDLYARLPAIKRESITVQQLANKLTKDESLVIFQRFQKWMPIQPQYLSGLWGTRKEDRYLALVLRQSGSVAAVDLGPATHIDKLISSAIVASRTPGLGTEEVTTAWHHVSEQLLPQSLLAALKGSQTWIISPDAELFRIPFFAIPSPNILSRQLSEVVRIRLVTNGRDLVDVIPQSDNVKRNPPLVLADPAYGPSHQGPWQRLAFSKAEGIAVANLFGVNPKLGDEASEDALKEQANINPALLHIASHAYYGNSSIPLETRRGKSRPATNQESSGPLDPRYALIRLYDDMLNSAIVLAGANRSDGTGYLYAKEVAQLQLDGTDLVVLSACETAAGEHQSGVGLYGLQRALQVAGARSTLLSLWKVDDAATAAFMERYYDKLLNQRMGKREALLAVQREFRNGELNPSWKDWAYWAAWQLVGDPGPLRR
jgi:tetratricopeptide (TPR) repeat protein